MGLSKKTMRPVTDLQRYKEGIRGQETLRQLGGQDDDAKKRKGRYSKRCPLKEESWICAKSREVHRLGDKIIPFVCTSTNFYESCPIWIAYRKE